jgi:hypothetical protein
MLASQAFSHLSHFLSPVTCLLNNVWSSSKTPKKTFIKNLHWTHTCCPELCLINSGDAGVYRCLMPVILLTWEAEIRRIKILRPAQAKSF